MTSRRLRAPVAVLALAGLTTPILGARVDAVTPTPLSCATALVTHWTLARLAAETIVVPVDATAVSTMSSAARDGFGGIILFGSTGPRDFAQRLAAVQSASVSGYPMAVMTDQEGGGVQRLTNLVPSIPWAKSMGSWSAARITAAAKRVGTALVGLGVNVDLAPVLDVDASSVFPGPANPDGLRSFSGSPSVVATDATAFAAGLAAAGVVAVAKHFPGLGGSNANTDVAPAHTRPWATLRARDLVPFARAIHAGVPAIMLSNATVPGLTTLPSSISPIVVNYLRATMGFGGLIVTDSLGAGAISAVHLSVPAASVAALRAGADEVLFGVPSPPATSLSLARQVRAAIVAAVVKGTLARTTLVAAAAQVLAARRLVSCPPPTTTTSL